MLMFLRILFVCKFQQQRPKKTKKKSRSFLKDFLGPWKCCHLIQGSLKAHGEPRLCVFRLKYGKVNSV